MKGFLPTEGTPDRYEASRSRDTLTIDLGAALAFSDPCTKAKSRRHGHDAALAKAREAEAAAERDRGVRGSVAVGTVGRQRPRFMTSGCSHEVSCRRWPAEAVPDVVKRPVPPVLPCGAQDSVGRPRCESGERSRERTRCGCTQFVWVAEIGRTHRASSSPVVPQGPLVSEGASREEVQSSV